jgi:tryptophanyl-tRNA synthetase
MADRNEEFIVTPWEVSGKIDYQKLVKKFGTQLIDENLLNRLKKYLKPLHPMLRRNIFYSHRDLDWLLDMYEDGTEFYLYTGRGPSGNTHLGHLMPWIFTKYLQDCFDVKLYFQLTEDEKFLFHPELSIDATTKYAYDNILDVIAIGFKPEKTKIFLDCEYIKSLYKIAIKVAKKVTFSTAKAVFGFDTNTNIGAIFYTSIQAAPAFLESELQKRNVPCLIPCAIDQDAHFRVARDVAPLLKYYKPASMYCKMFPSLLGADKMSSSIPEATVFTTDPPTVVKKKILNAFTGGGVSEKEQREKGGNPEICAVYQYNYYLFELNDSKLAELELKCRNGEILCGECKLMLVSKINAFLDAHQKKRESAREKIDEYMIKD